MDTLTNSLSGLVDFGLYFALSLIAIVVFKTLYALVTPHDEYKLIKDDKNVAAGIAFGGAIVGFCIALAGAAANSVGYLDFLIWGTVALLAQLLAFSLTRFFMPLIAERIENDEASAAIVLAAMSIGVGILNAACMSY